MSSKQIYDPNDDFNKVRPLCILAAMILLFLLLIFLAPRGPQGSGGGIGGGHGTGIGSGSGPGSGQGTGSGGSGEGSGSAQGAGKGSASGGSGGGAASGGKKEEQGTAAQIPTASQARKNTASAGSKADGENAATPVSAPKLPEKQWKSAKNPTRSETELWFYAKRYIRNIARDKRDVFEFPEFGVPDTGMKKISGNVYEVTGFCKVRNHEGKEKMYRFSLKINLEDYLCYDLNIKDM